MSQRHGKLFTEGFNENKRNTKYARFADGGGEACCSQEEKRVRYINAKSSLLGETALFTLPIDNHVGIFQFLIEEMKANRTILSHAGDSALHAAVNMGRAPPKEVLNLIVFGCVDGMQFTLPIILLSAFFGPKRPF